MSFSSNTTCISTLCTTPSSITLSSFLVSVHAMPVYCQQPALQTPHGRSLRTTARLDQWQDSRKDEEDRISILDLALELRELIYQAALMIDKTISNVQFSRHHPGSLLVSCLSHWNDTVNSLQMRSIYLQPSSTSVTKSPRHRRYSRVKAPLVAGS